jgi:glycosyltransferase involved in cell wall biosynthesis
VNPISNMAKRELEGMQNSRPTVSVIVAAYNERRHIEACLQSLLTQAYPSVEVIVVDDGSTDGTGKLAEAAGGVCTIRQDHRGAGAARNVGARAAHGEILVFVDGDMLLPPEFLDHLIAPIIRGEGTGTFTKEIMVANGDHRWARAHMLGRALPTDCHFPPNFPDRWENFRAIRREAFERVGGFDEIGHGEDVTLGRKLGEDALAAPGAVCWHFEPETLGDVFASARWLGRGERITESPLHAPSYRPWRLLRRALGLAVINRMPSLFVYRLVWDAGVILGWLTRDTATSAK